MRRNPDSIAPPRQLLFTRLPAPAGIASTAPGSRLMTRSAPLVLGASSASPDSLVFADLLVDGIVEELRSLSPASVPRFLSHERLAWYINDYPFTERASEVFSLLVLDAGPPAMPYAERVQRSMEWAGRHAGGSYAKAISAHAAMHAYQSAEYLLAEDLIGQTMERWPEISTKMLLIRAMTLTAQRKFREAEKILLPFSSGQDPESAAESLFLLAWLCFQDLRMEEARQHLGSLQESYPKSLSARNAARIIEALSQISQDE